MTGSQRKIPARDEAKFEAWMKRVDIACQKKCGLSIYDLSDLPFSDYFDDRVSPTQVVREALIEEGF